MITRARHCAPALERALRALGAEALVFPTIETAPPDSYEALDRTLERVGSFDWIVFTSATGVESLAARMAALGRDPSELRRARLAAIGPATAERLRRRGLEVAVVPAEYRAEAIAAALGPERIRGARFLIPRAQVAREALPRMLLQMGAREVEVVPAYKTLRPEAVGVERIRELIATGAIDLVSFTSSSTVDNFCELVGRPVAGLRAAVIGPVTAATARRRGFSVVACPAEYTVAALVAAIRDYFRARA